MLLHPQLGFFVGVRGLVALGSMVRYVAFCDKSALTRSARTLTSIRSFLDFGFCDCSGFVWVRQDDFQFFD